MSTKGLVRRASGDAHECDASIDPGLGKSAEAPFLDLCNPICHKRDSYCAGDSRYIPIVSTAHT
jgi:hypothetical protein